MLLTSLRYPHIAKNVSSKILQECRLNQILLSSSVNTRNIYYNVNNRNNTTTQKQSVNIGAHHHKLHQCHNISQLISSRTLSSTSCYSEVKQSTPPLPHTPPTPTHTHTIIKQSQAISNNPFIRKSRTFTPAFGAGFGVNLVNNFHTGTVRFSDINNVTSDTAKVISNNSTQVISDQSEVISDGFNTTSEGVESVLTGLDVENIVAIAEPTFRELGLCSGYPSGVAQMLMEYLHVTIGLPWWQVVGCMTILLRIVVFPIVIKAQQNMVRMNNHQPEIQKFQKEAAMARLKGDNKTAMMLDRGMNNYCKEHNCHIMKSLMPMMFQGVFFTSMFFALRGMAGVPVPSLATGGLAWFTDLTISDPLYLLPMMTASTLALQLYLGADGINTATMPAIMRKFMFAMPIISLPFMIQFPAVLNLYWLTNNIISVFQAKVIRSENMRAKFGIEKQIMWKPEDLPMTNFYKEMQIEVDRQQREEEKKKLQKNMDEYLRKKAQEEKKQELLTKFREENKRLIQENLKLKQGQKSE